MKLPIAGLVLMTLLTSAALAKTPAKGGAEPVIRMIYKPFIYYPYEARHQGLEGRAILGLHVRADGTVSRVEILKSTGHKILDDASIAAFSKARFTPSKATVVKIPITYTMHRWGDRYRSGFFH